MNGSSILKKTLPVLCSLVLIIVIVIVVSAVSNDSRKVPTITDPDKEYISIKETIDGKEYTYSLTRQELYNELKSGIGLSGSITLTNIELLSKAIYKDNTSYFAYITEEEIEEEKNIAIYGEDADIDSFTEEEKEEMIEDFKTSMFTGYGYANDEEIDNHYRLVLAKELYAKVQLEKEIAEADEDDPYFDDDEVSDYFDDNYNKDYMALIIPFSSSEKATQLLQQLGVINDSGRWVHLTLEEVEEGSGIYETKKGDALTVNEVVEVFFQLYDIVNGYKDEPLVKGEYTTTTDEEGNISYEFSEGCDYVVVDCADKVNELKPILETIREQINNGANAEALAELEKVEAKLDEIISMLVFDDQTSVFTTNISNLKLALDDDVTGDDEDKEKNDPTVLIQNLLTACDEFDTEKVMFNTDNNESKLFYKYEDLYAYDSKIPSELKNSRVSYSPFKVDTASASQNTTTQKWYTSTTFTSSPVYYLMLKIKDGETPVLADVKDEIIAKLTEEELTDDIVEKKMAELRAEYGFQILDATLEEQYIEAIESYDVEYKKSKKQNSEVMVKLSADGYTKEFTADDLFNYMEKTSGMSTVISELTYQRLMNNTLFNKYYDATTKDWLGDEGEEMRDDIIAQIENQRIYFLSGSYSSYGYDPTTMSWEQFLTDINGADDEVDLAFLILYSTVSTDFMKVISDLTGTDGEGKDVDLVSTYQEALASKAWELLEKRMQDVLNEAFSVNGEHLLVSVYEDPKDAINSGTPVDPSKWTEEQRELAKELVAEVQTYLNVADGTYAQKLQAVVTAFNNAPYAVKDADGNYVKVIDSSANEYKYILTCAECTIDLSKYKSAGLAVKYESLGTFANGSMVENFENAAKEIWEKDMADGEYNRITVYPDPIETEFGYHLYVNLSSAKAATYEGVVVNEEGVVQYETVDGEEVAKTEERILPSLYEIRLNALLTALNAIDQTTLSEEDAEALADRIAELTPLLVEGASTAITTYSSTVLSQMTGSSFSSLLQQAELKTLLGGNVSYSSSIYKVEDLIRILDLNNESVYENTLTGLEVGDELGFDITNYVIEKAKADK